MLRRCLCRLEKLVIVESPNKVIKIEGLLSNASVIPDWSFGSSELRRVGGSGPERAVAMATTGHFMSLKELSWVPQRLQSPPADEEFPPNGVVAAYALEWELSPGRKIRDTYNHYVKEKSLNISEVIVATDPDREGELIAVHARVLFQKMFPKIKVPFTRAYIHSITESGVVEAMRARSETFDEKLSMAAETRHAMDRAFGFLGSSVVRHANPQLRSVGRVQTPSLILISEREARIANVVKNHKPGFEVRSECSFRSAGRGGSATQTVTLRPTAATHEALEARGAVDWAKREDVRRLGDSWELEKARDFTVVGEPVTQQTVSAPPEPFTMPTLLAKANRLLHLTTTETSTALQDLFQMGYITYPRTDSSRIEESALQGIYAAIRAEHGASAVFTAEQQKEKGSAKRRRKSSAADDEKGAGNVEDAHEAVRPTDMKLTAEKLGPAVVAPTRLVYDLIRRHTMAAFMAPMETERVAATIEFTAPGTGDRLQFTLEGRHTARPGWSAAFRQSASRGTSGSSGGGAAANGGKSSSAEEDMDQESLEKGEQLVRRVSGSEFRAIQGLRGTPAGLSLRGLEVMEPKMPVPLPYSEGGLIEELKNNGVGRPSTYPTIVSTLLARGYIELNPDKRCVTTPAGRALVALAQSTFPSLVDIGFTSQFEKSLDRIAKPTSSKPVLPENPKLADCDYVLSLFMSRLCNYITEAARTQRAAVAEMSFLSRRSGDAGEELDAAAKNELVAERERVAQLVPEFVETLHTVRTFSALQKNLHGFLRANFPATPKALPDSVAPATSGGGSSKSRSASSRSRSPRKSPASSSAGSGKKSFFKKQ